MLETRLHRILRLYGVQIVDNLQQQMKINENIATGKALESLRYEIHKEKDKTILNILGESYIKKLDEGRKPGGKQPSYRTIQKWIKDKQNFVIRDRDGRALPKTKGNIKRAAFNIASYIQKNGTKGNNMINYSMGKVMNNVLGEVITAFVEEEINKMIKNKTI